MSNGAHIIGRQRIRCTVSNKEEVNFVFSQVSRLANGHLTDQLEKLFTELVPGEEVLRIDQLKINVGDIPRGDFSAQVTQRVVQALRQEITRQLAEAKSRPDQQKVIVPPEEYRFSLLKYFLTTGRFPWWANQRELPSPSALLLTVEEEQPEALSKLLVKLLPQPAIARRLQYQFSAASILTINRQQAEDIKATAAEELTPKTNHPPMEESLYIQNAGLVILAPFLNRYFTMLGMLEEQQFLDPEAAVRGVLLLEYLASGRTTVPEHELVFNKILCGLDVSTPVPEAIELTAEEENVSQQLLNSVLQNWDKMSNSTVENLRGSFLLRNGMLLEEEEYWSLQVESAGYDILLSFLPWTISILNLPWMGQRVETTWDTKMQ